MYARIGTFEIPPSKLQIAVEFFRRFAVPAFSKSEGFLGYQCFVDIERGLIVGISQWTTRAALESSIGTAQEVLKRAAELGASIRGEPQILEQAFDEKLAQ